MAHYSLSLVSWLARFIPWLALLPLLFYTYALFFVSPYLGFRFSSDGEVVEVYDRPEAAAVGGASRSLVVGDLIRQVDGVSWAEYRGNPWEGIFTEGEGHIYELLVVPQGESTFAAATWQATGFNLTEAANRLNSQWWLAFIFWVAGTAAWLFIRPRDQVWWLFLLFNYVTALWWATVGPALTNTALGTLFFRAAFWFCLPVYLHFHWNFPTLLRRLPKVVWISLYLLALAGAIGEWLTVVPGQTYYLPFLAGLFGTVLILMVRSIWRPAERSNLHLLLIAVFLTALPIIIVGVTSLVGVDWPFYLEGGAVLGFSAIPGAYFYTFYRRQFGQVEGRAKQLRRFYIITLLFSMVALLVVAVSADLSPTEDMLPQVTFALVVLLALAALTGLAPILLLAALSKVHMQGSGGMELRANRLAIPVFFFLLLAVIAAFPIFGVLALSNSAGLMGVILLLLTLVVGVVTWRGYGRFERYIEERVLGIPLPPAGLQESYAARIATSLKRDELVRLLRDEMLPSLLVRESALVFWDKTHPTTSLYVQRVEDSFRLPERDVAELLAQAGRFLPDGAEESYAWVRLILPLSFDRELFGLWLLGRRDPDDLYGPAEIPILQALADQTTVALVNILQAEDLQAIYQANIEREEKERLGLAHELHDDVLNELAALLMHLDQTSPQFQETYDTVVDRLRRMVRGLRPPMLELGLYAALDSLVDDLLERSEEKVAIHFDVTESSTRYAPQVEQYLFRIVHQAAENALRHAEARRIEICGRLEADRIYLEVSDDGKGFVVGERPNLAALVADGHYGLAGMHERAALIKAVMVVHSTPGEGSWVTINWQEDGRHE